MEILRGKIEPFLYFGQQYANTRMVNCFGKHLTLQHAFGGFLPEGNKYPEWERTKFSDRSHIARRMWQH